MKRKSTLPNLILIMMLLLPLSAISNSAFATSKILPAETNFKSPTAHDSFSCTQLPLDCDLIILKNKDTLFVRISRIDMEMIEYVLCVSKDSSLSVSKRSVYAVKYSNDYKIYYNNESYGAGNNNSFGWGDHVNSKSDMENKTDKKNTNLPFPGKKKQHFTADLMYYPMSLTSDDNITGPGIGGSLGYLLFLKDNHTSTVTTENLFEDIVGFTGCFESAANISYNTLERDNKTETLLNLFYSQKNGFMKRNGYHFPLYFPFELGLSYLNSESDKTITYFIASGLGLDIRIKNLTISGKYTIAYIVENDCLYTQITMGITF